MTAEHQEQEVESLRSKAEKFIELLPEGSYAFPLTLTLELEDGKWKKKPHAPDEWNIGSYQSSWDELWETANGYGFIGPKITNWDFDLPDAEDRVKERLEILTLDHTLTVETPRGLHRLFIGGDDVTRAQVANINGFDIRSGLSGYTIGPGSKLEGYGEWKLQDESKRIQPAPHVFGQEKSKAETDGSTSSGGQVAKGGRNDALARVVGFQLLNGVTGQALLGFALGWNADRCVPPLPVDEVRTTVASIESKGTTNDILDLAEMREHFSSKSETPTGDYAKYFKRGGSILSAEDNTVAVWGDDEVALWSERQPMIVAGPTGVGKSTIAQNLLLSAMGVGPSEFCGMPVRPLEDDEFVLYLAADRPIQIEVGMARIARAAWPGELVDLEALLDRHLLVHEGPLVTQVEKDTWIYVKMIEAAEQQLGKRCAWLVIDSLKDMTLDLIKPEAANAINSSSQLVVQRGTECLSLHHSRKGQQGAVGPKTIDDIYGGMAITAGSGTVLFAHAPGKELDEDKEGYDINLRLLKEANGPWNADMRFTRKDGSIKAGGGMTWDEYVESSDVISVRQIRMFVKSLASDKKARKAFNDLKTNDLVWEYRPSINTSGGATEAELVRRER